MSGHTNRKYKETGGYVEGQFVIEGERVRYLDLPSEPVRDSFELELNGRPLDPSQIRLTYRVISLRDESTFQEGDFLRFAYRRDSNTLLTAPEEAENFGVSLESFKRADTYTYVLKEDEDSDYAVFVMEFPSVSVFGSCKGEALSLAQKVVAYILDEMKSDGETPPQPLGFYEIPNVTDRLVDDNES